MSDNIPAPVTYDLSGGGKVSVYKPFGGEKYFAVVDEEGVYPEDGKIAKNVGRREYMLVLEGEFEFTVDGETKTVKQGETIFVGDGAEYQLTGKGKTLVFVEDSEGGKTEIVDKN